MLEDVVDELKKYDIFDVSVFKPTYKKEISLFISKNIIRFELLILFGGDGTLNEVVNGLMESNRKIKLLYVPSGTVNDVGNYLKIPFDYKKAFKLLEEKPVLMDVCQVNEMYFLYVLACGKFSNVSYGGNINKSKKVLGRLFYFLRAIKEFFKFFKMKFKVNDQEEYYSLFLGLNIWHVAGFNIRGKEKNKLNDGKIMVVFFKSATFLSVVSIGLFLLFGIYLKAMMDVYIGNYFLLKTDKPYQFNTDGEESYFTDSIKINVVNEALKIYIPKKSIKKYF